MSVLETTLSGWGRYPVVESRVQRPEKRAMLAALVADAHPPSLTARGAGRSYGDAALNGRGITILTERLNRMLAFDAATGVLRCEAGLTLADILDVFVPRGWFLPVTPGTKFVTVGGAIAFDIHGKNHHCDGSFSHFVRSFDLLTASGEVVSCSRTSHPDLFWATMGGAGLTGFITEVSFELRPLETAYIRLHTIKARDLDEALALFDEHEPAYPYSVAWIDCLASGSSLGRSILMLGAHALREHLSPAQAADPLHYESKQRLGFPFDLPGGLLNPLTVRTFNALYYGRQRDKEKHVLSALEPFFYPLDAIGDWNRMYGKRGFVQFQCVFPLAQSREGLIKLLTALSRKGWASFLAVLKRFGPASQGLLSFPMPGYTLSLDIPVKNGLDAFLQELNELVLDYDGRVYLAKDASLTPDAFRTMYPAFPKWLAIKSQVDPLGVFASALSERLQIYPSA